MAGPGPRKQGRPTTTGVKPIDPDYAERLWLSDLDNDVRRNASIEIEGRHLLIEEDMSFLEWCSVLAAEGLEVDGKPFELDNRPAMAWIYEQIPTHKEDAYRYMLVLMKCAQVGFTVMEMLAAIYMGVKFGPAIVGMFLPDMRLAQIKSSVRFMQVVRSIPDVHKTMVFEANDGSGQKSGEGNVGFRQIANAKFVFSWTSGRATTESIPMDLLSFDEVQEMTLAQIEKTLERLSASEIRMVLMGSTANWPEADIHHFYLLGTRYRFFTKCPTCGSAKPLDDFFPECIKTNPETGRLAYVCENGHFLVDTQDGEWRAEFPERDLGPESVRGIPLLERPIRIRSIHFSQFLSPTISAEEMLTAYTNATDMKNFFNRKLGKPYLDPSQVPVTLEHLARCVEAGRKAEVKWKTRGRGCYMGIDQMGNFNVVVIKERMPDGRQACIHVEEVYHEDPFSRCDELMEAYGIAVCVVEINPNYNDVKRFANRHRGRVFICDSFGSLKEDMIIWGDGPKLVVSDRRTDEEERDRYTLRMDQYKCMQVSMARFTADNPLCLFPDPQGLVQDVKEKGRTQQMAVLPRAFHHFTKTALVAEKDEEAGTNQYKRSVKKVGIDPHFSYANMLCDVAWARSHGTAMFIIPEQKGTSTSQQMRNVGMPDTVAAMIEHQAAAKADTCGKCTAFDADMGMCKERSFFTKAEAPGCELFVDVNAF